MKIFSSAKESVGAWHVAEVSLHSKSIVGSCEDSEERRLHNVGKAGVVELLPRRAQDWVQKQSKRRKYILVNKMKEDGEAFDLRHGKAEFRICTSVF